MIKLALQLYTVRDEAEKDLDHTLEMVAAAGYSGVEFAGYYGYEAADIKALLAKYRLKPVSSHVHYTDLKKEFTSTVGYVKTLGCNYITIPGLPPEMLQTEAATLKSAAILDDMARRVRSKGLSLSYHNHIHEFETKFSSRTIEKIFFDEAPALNFEVDTGWAGVAGVDNREFLLKLGYRADLIHLKDVDNDDIPVEIGDGVLNIKSVIDTADKIAIRWVIVEQETMRAYSPFESIAVSYRNIQEKYIKYLN